MSATEMIEREKVELLNDLHRQVEEHRGQALALAIEAGTVLEAIKASLPHGEFGTWLGEHFDGSDRTAQTYMQLASAPEETRNAVADMSIRQARDLVAKPRKLSPREMGDVFAGQLGDTRRQPPADEPATWTDAQLRKDAQATELLTEARRLQESAQDLTDRRAVARAYRDAAVRAQRAAAVLDGLAITFE